jgi:hypothetical protein
MSLIAHDKRPEVSPLVQRTAHAIYLASLHVKSPIPYETLGHAEQQRFEDMAKAALTEAYREPATV